MRPWKPSPKAPLGLLVGLLFLLGGCVDFGPIGPLPDARDGARLNNEIGVQNTFNGYIRIGVVPSANSISIGSAGSFVVLSKPTAEVVLTGSDGNILVEIETQPLIGTHLWLQVIYTTDQTYIDNWLASASAYGYDTMVEQHPTLPGKRLLLGKWPTTTSTAERDAIKAEAIARGLAGSDAFFRTITSSQQGEVRLTYGGSTVVASAPVVLEATELVRIGGALYRGVAEVAFNSTGTLAGINEVYLEDYLYGVVPRELPPVPYGLLEAQKAQAVTARTYALANLGKRRADGYDLLPTTADQVYGGYEAEHPVSTQAVDETRGVLAVSGGVLISTLYHSTSGGYTANSEDVFTNPFSYLRGVPDAERGEAMEHVPTLEVFKRAANPTNLRAAAEGDFEADWSAYHRWVVEWTVAEMAEILSATFSTTVTQVFAINVIDRADHGRVRQIEFVTNAGTLVGLKDQIRSRLQYFTATDTRASLRSTLFFIEPMTDPYTQAIIGWKAYGGGWGHGVGMSQTGAVGMAERGRTYEQILKHYYQGAELETRSY